MLLCLYNIISDIAVYIYIYAIYMYYAHLHYTQLYAQHKKKEQNTNKIISINIKEYTDMHS